MELFHSDEAEPRSRWITGSTGVDQWGSGPVTGMAELETGITVRAQAGIKAQAEMKPLLHPQGLPGEPPGRLGSALKAVCTLTALILAHVHVWF